MLKLNVAKPTQSLRPYDNGIEIQTLEKPFTAKLTREIAYVIVTVENKIHEVILDAGNNIITQNDYLLDQ